MFKDKEEAGGRDLMERMGKYTDEIMGAAKMANDYVIREKIKNIASYVARVGGLGGLLYAGRHEVGKQIRGE